MPYQWHYEPPMHCISNPLSMVYRTTLSMVFWPPYKWYIKIPTCGISNPLLMIFWTSLSVVYRPPCLSLDNSSLFMVYQTHYPWYSDPYHSWYIRSLPISWLEMRGFKIPWGSTYIAGGRLVFNKGIQYTMNENLPLVNIPWGSKYHISPVNIIQITSSNIWFYHRPSRYIYLLNPLAKLVSKSVWAEQDLSTGVAVKMTKVNKMSWTPLGSKHFILKT